MAERFIEDQITASRCRGCDGPLRPWQFGAHRQHTDLDLCSACWKRTPAGRAYHSQARRERKQRTQRKASCPACIHQVKGRCTLGFPDRDPGCVAFTPHPA